MFGKNFDEQVQQAVQELAGLGVRNFGAKVEGRVVTLTGEAPDMATKTRAMQEFNSRVETENTVNMIRIASASPTAAAPTLVSPAAAPPAATAAAGGERVHRVATGETLSAIAQHYYGKASAYTKIFEANKDVLKDPDKIQVGQTLRIP